MYKIYIYSKYLFYFFIIFTLNLALQNYEGQKYIYLIFSIVSIFHLLYCLEYSSYFVDKFMAILIWLGFWFKFSVEVGYSIWGKVHFREGSGGLFDYTGNSYDEVLIISTIAILSLILSSFLVRKFFNIYNFDFKKDPNEFYQKNRIKIYSLYLSVVVFFGLTNFYYGFYQKGMMPNENFSIFVSYIYRWLLLFGFTSAGCVLLNFEINSSTHHKKYFLLVFIESCVSNISLISRSAIFNLSSLIIGLIFYLKKNIIKKEFFLFLIFFSIIIFLISFKIIDNERKKIYYSEYNNPSIENIKIASLDLNFIPEYSKLKEGLFGEILYLVCNRWVGIDALMAINSIDNEIIYNLHEEEKTRLGFELLKESFSEEFSPNRPSFYEDNFLIKNKNLILNEDLSERNNIIILPGIIAYLYISGSIFFLFFSIIFIMFFCYFLEYLYFIFGGKNVFLCSFMGYVFASRLIHSGYLVSNNFKYIISLLINLILIVIIIKVFKHLNKHTN